MAKYKKQPVQQDNVISKKKAGFFKSPIGIVISAVVVIALGLLLWWFLRPAEVKSNFVVTQDNADTIMDEIKQKTKEGMFEVMMNTNWTFDSTTKPSKDAYVANSKRNTKTIYFEVILDKTNEVLMKSPLIPVGSKINNIALNKDLPKGKHSVSVVYHLMKDDNTELSKVAVDAKIIVLK